MQTQGNKSDPTQTRLHRAISCAASENAGREKACRELKNEKLDTVSLYLRTSRQAAAMALATSPAHDQTDRLSNLPDELLVTILSLLPTRMAACTSLLSRRFRHLCDLLWETSPSLQLISRDFPFRKTSAAHFETMADRVLLRRSPSHPLLGLRLEFERYFRFCSHQSELSFYPSLYVQARSLGVRHLAIDGCGQWPNSPTLPIIFSITFLESLSLSFLTSGRQVSPFPSAVALTNLKSLSIGEHSGDSAELNVLLSQLCSLEEFCLTVEHQIPVTGKSHEAPTPCLIGSGTKETASQNYSST